MELKNTNELKKELQQKYNENCKEEINELKKLAELMQKRFEEEKENKSE